MSRQEVRCLTNFVFIIHSCWPWYLTPSCHPLKMLNMAHSAASSASVICEGVPSSSGLPTLLTYPHTGKMSKVKGCTNERQKLGWPIWLCPPQNQHVSWVLFVLPSAGSQPDFTVPTLGKVQIQIAPCCTQHHCGHWACGWAQPAVWRAGTGPETGRHFNLYIFVTAYHGGVDFYSFFFFGGGGRGKSKWSPQGRGRGKPQGRITFLLLSVTKCWPLTFNW